MKKLTSIILILAILYSCLTFVGCGIHYNANAYDSFVFDESVTDFDTSFLSKNLRAHEDSYVSYVSFGEIAEGYQTYGEMENEFFLIQNDLESAYFLCLYTYDEPMKMWCVIFDSLFGTQFSAKYFTWYRFDEYELTNIPKEVDGKRFVAGYFMCNSIIKKDLVKGVEYNAPFTFYRYFGTSELSWADAVSILGVRDNMLCYRSDFIADSHLNGSEHLFMTTYNLQNKSRYAGDFEIYLDENGVEYLILFSYEGVYENGKVITHDEKIEKELNILYEPLLPYFEIIELPECENCDHQTIIINLDIFEEIAFGSKQD